MKLKKILLLALALVIIMGGIWGIREVYLYYYPEVIITYSHQESEDVYLSLPMYAINARSRFGYDSRYDEEMKKWWTATNEVVEWLHTDFVKPIYVTSNIEIMDGKTIITYQGMATSLDGEVTEIDREIVLDFVVSKNLLDFQE